MSLVLNKYKNSDKLKTWARQDLVTHSVFWMLLYVILIVLDIGRNTLGFAMWEELLNIAFYMLIVYINILYLIPRFLTQKNFLWYISLLVLTALIITPIKTLVFHTIYSDQPIMQDLFIDNQSSIFLTTFIMGSASTIYKVMNDWVMHQNERQALQNKTLESELNFLKSQINPHFLFNTLNNLYALTLKKSDQAPEIVLKLSEMMRYMLYECNESRVFLQKEINYLKNYLELEKLRQKKDIDINLTVIGDPGSKMISPLLFIPFVENSFKHGLTSQIEAGFVNITIDVKDESVQFDVINSKASVVPSIFGKKKSGGIGLINIQKRLELLYPKKHSLEITDAPNEYKISMQLKLK